MTRQGKAPAAGEPFVVQVDDVVRALLPGYLANRRKELEKIRALLTARDFRALYVIGHDLKGSGGAYGLPPLSDIGARLERAAEDDDAERVATLLVEIEAFLSSVRVAP